MSRVDFATAISPRFADNLPAAERNRAGPDFAAFLPRTPGVAGGRAPASAAASGFREDVAYAEPDGARAIGSDAFGLDEAASVEDVDYGAPQATARDADRSDAKAELESVSTVKLTDAGEVVEADSTSAPVSPQSDASGVAPGLPATTLVNAQPLATGGGGVAAVLLSAAQLLAGDVIAADGAPADPGAVPESSEAPDGTPPLLALAFLQASAPGERISRAPSELLSAARADRSGRARPGESEAASGPDPQAVPGEAAPGEVALPPAPASAAAGPATPLLPGARPGADGLSLEGFTPVNDASRGGDGRLTTIDAAAARGDAGTEGAREAAGTAGLPRLNVDSLSGLAARIARRHEAGNSVFDLRLDPAELGRISVRIEIDAGNRAQAVIAAERPEALAELTRNARALEASLRQSGLTLADDGLRFQLADQSPGGDAAARQGSSGEGDGPSGARTGSAGRNLQFSAPDEGLRAAVRRVISGRVDLVA